ncbi:MAG: hypothetical protein WCV67_12585 [Victivallaceae bacterium]
MKRLSLLLLLLLTPGVNAAKVALIPTVPELAPVADQTLAAMANDPGIEFIERASIEAALNERKLAASGLTAGNLADLGKTIHADLFAVIVGKLAKKEDGGTVPSGLIVYDTRNGFRLANIALPEKQEDCVKDVIGQLRKSLEVSSHPDKQILLSLAAVRDAGVPERFKYRQAFIAADLERRLGGIPSVTVLERDYLESVNLERKITGQMFKLAPSARLLRLEFAPGSSPEIVKLTLRVTDATDNELFRYEQDNCSAENTVEKMMTELAGYLKEPVPAVSGSAVSEAARFFEEFRFFNSRKEYRAARAKLNAAISLNPEHRDYREWQMLLNQAEVLAGNYKRMLAANQKNMDLAQEFKRDFPGTQHSLYINYNIFPLSGFRKGSTPQDFAGMAKWTEIFRPLYEEEFRRLGPPFDLRNGINSYTEWQNYNQYCWRMCVFELYYDCDAWAAAINKIALEHLKVSREFAEKHPEWCAPHSFDGRIFRLLMEVGHLVLYLREKSTLDSQAVGEKVLSGCDEYIVLAANHPLPQLRIEALQLKLMRETVKNKYTSTAFGSAMTEYCKQASAIDGKVFETIGVREIENFFGGDNDYRDIARKAKKEFHNPNFQSDTIDSLFAAVNAVADPDEKAAKVLELAPELLKYKEQAFVDVKARNFFFDLGAKLAKAAYLKQNEPSREALAALNEDVSISRIAAVSMLHEKKSKTSRVGIQNSLLDGNNLNLLLSQRTKEKEGMREAWALARLDVKTAEMQMLTPWTPAAEISADRNPERKPPFAIEDDLAVIAGNKTVYVMSLRENTINEIKDLPSPVVMGLAILNRRIYVFAGEEKSGRSGYASETILFSCDPDGGNRKLHISTSRDDKRDFLDSNTAFSVYNLIADRPRSRLLFNAVFSPNHGSGLLEYSLASNSSRFRLRGRKIDSPMTVVNGVIFCSFADADYYTYDLATDQPEMFFSVSDGKAKYCLDAKYHQPREIIYKPAFFSRAGQIWFGGENTVKLLTLPDVSQSPLIFMPPAATTTWHHLVFPHPDGKSAIAVDENNIYKVTPK